MFRPSVLKADGKLFFQDYCEKTMVLGTVAVIGTAGAAIPAIAGAGAAAGATATATGAGAVAIATGSGAAAAATGAGATAIATTTAGVAASTAIEGLTIVASAFSGPVGWVALGYAEGN